jgi:hypothetical protein
MKRYQPALLGGLFIGILSSLPLVQLGNVCCCLWVVTGGMLTVYLQQQARPEPIDVGEAVLGGLIAGVMGALISGVVTMAMLGMTGAAMQEQMRSAMDQLGELPPETREMITRWFTGPNVLVLTTMLGVVVNAVFGMLGALLGVALFKKKAPPVAPPPIVPPMS